MNNTEEDRLEYSPQAESVKHAFYNTSVMMYVEGQYDVTFWFERFHKLIPTDFCHIEAVQGKENLNRHKENILSNVERNVIVAYDLDYSEFNDTDEVSDARILHTYGHSIENTMFCPISVAIFVRTILNDTSDYLSEVNNWFNKFCESAKPLLPYDIMNSKFPSQCTTPQKVLGNGFHYFSSDTDDNLDNIKIQNFIYNIKQFYDDKRINTLIEKIETNNKDIRFLIQGHFLADAVCSYIRYKYKKRTGKGNKFSNESLYAAFPYCLTDTCKECLDKQFIEAQIKRAYDYFMNTENVSI